MKKSYLIIIVLVIVLSVVGMWYSQSKKSSPATIPQENNKVVIPSVSTNPLDNKPDINPADQTNPFKNVKTNPFE